MWLSTTLISALREMIELYTVYFTVMQRFLDGLLDILVACICQGEFQQLCPFLAMIAGPRRIPIVGLDS